MASLLAHVNVLQGTDSHHGLSRGNTLPLAAIPFGLNHWSLQTAEGSWFFSPQHAKVQGIRCTHQPSPWIADYSAFVVMPQVGHRALSSERRASAYRLERSELHPHRMSVDLIRYGTRMEMAPTERGAIFQFSFPEAGMARVIVEPSRGISSIAVRADRRTVVGFTRGAAGGVPAGFAMYFVATFDRPMSTWCLFSGSQTVDESPYKDGERTGVAAEFAGGGRITMRVATSFISIEQAELNLARELNDASFDEVVARAEAAWDAALGCIEIETDDERAKRTFASCLYRTQLFPRVWHEIDASGATVHRSPYDGGVHSGVLYTDNGFWDTYRTVYPFFALTMPERLGEILEGWTNAAKEGGWFPQWASPGYRACMVGTHIDAVMADAVVRGIRNFDVDAALNAMVRHAHEVGDKDGAWGRIGIEDYLSLGYVAHDRHHESVARSLDYAYDDFCIAQVATAQGDDQLAERMRARAFNYRHLYDPSVGFMRGRNADGTWLEPWDEFGWGSPYVEGGPWQSSFAVPHDPAGLMRLMGGEAAFVEKLDRMLTLPPHFTVGPYGFEIHEMTEMAVADFGQYAHSNQPVHHVLYLYTAAGRPWRTQREVRRVMDELYTQDALPGDEDNGEMSAWYVLSALGIFPLCPGHPSWTLGTPRFRRATVHLPHGREWVVEASNPEVPFVERVRLNDMPYAGLALAHDTVMAGGRMKFTTRAEPSTTVAAANHRPFSMSAY